MSSRIIFVPSTEWDLGLSKQAYTTLEAAKEAIRNAHEVQNMEEPFSSCWEDGLYTIDTWRLYD